MSRQEYENFDFAYMLNIITLYVRDSIEEK